MKLREIKNQQVVGCNSVEDHVDRKSDPPCDTPPPEERFDEFPEIYFKINSISLLLLEDHVLHIIGDVL